MPATDREIVKMLSEKLGLTSVDAEYDDKGHVISLNLPYSSLSQYPLEIGHLTNLQALYLHGNQLSQLPPEIGHLTNLRELHLDNNQLSQLPPEIGQLTTLQKLSLNNNSSFLQRSKSNTLS